MRLFIVRHGKSEWNEKRILQGQQPVPLSENGQKQASKLRQRFKNHTFDHIYTSDLLRAKQTAQEIAKHHENTPFVELQELRDITYGEIEGKHKDEIGWVSEQHYLQGPPAKGSETLQELFSRVQKARGMLYSKHKGQTILVVLHSTSSLALMTAIEGRTHETMYNTPKLANSGVAEYELTDEGFVVHCQCCTKHLE